jgi:predicted phage baseplate assembly protein
VPLPAPILDDRSYQQLRDELVRRIPVYAPEWTDHNASDPGITLIELFAFLGENLLYRFNQIPDATKLAFLRLLQLPLRPASAARALVTLARGDSGAAAVLVPIGTQLQAGNLPFSSVGEVSAWPLEVTAIGRIVTQAPQTQDAKEFTAAAIDARGGIRQGEQAAYYVNQTVPGDPAAPDAAPVDFATAAGPVDFGKSVDGTLWIAVRRTQATDPALLAGALLSLGFIPDPQVPAIDEIDPCPGSSGADPGSELVWQASTGVSDANGEPRYLALAAEGDTTRGLAQQGVVQLRLPASVLDLGVFALADPDLQGTGNFPPQIEDAQLAANVLFWIRGARRDPARPLAKVLFIGINATEVLQSVQAAPEFLGTGNAQADQGCTLVHKPVLAGSERIEVEEFGGWTAWEAVDGFEASGEDSRHYVLDPEAGTVRFGNGLRGRAPQIGERIRAVGYQWGGGAAGNVGAKAISKVNGFGQIKASNPLPAVGGAEGEAIAAAIERVPGEFRRHDRAVTAGDFQELALQTPGAAVGRAECMPLFDPRTRSQEAAGVVSVVVWPAQDQKHPNAPVPDRALLASVCAWLDARRLVTTELYVIPPTYRQIAVAIGLQAKPGYGIEAVRRWVELVVRQYLAPLPPYGPDGQGWPLGRAVYGPELEAAALQVEGVLLIECLRLAQRDASGQWVEAATDAVPVASGCLPRERVTLQPWEVPELAEITVVQGDALAPGEAVAGAATPLVPIPIPTVPEEC